MHKWLHKVNIFTSPHALHKTKFFIFDTSTIKVNNKGLGNKQHGMLSRIVPVFLRQFRKPGTCDIWQWRNQRNPIGIGDRPQYPNS